MFADLLLKRKEQRKHHQNCSRQLLPFVNTISFQEYSQERELSPWDSEENKNNKKLIQMVAKNEEVKINKRFDGNNQYYQQRSSKEWSPRLKKRELINKDLYELIKIQKKGYGMIDFKQHHSERLTKMNRIDVKLTQSWENQHPQSRHVSSISTQNHVNQPIVNYYPKSLPVKVKIHKQLIENHRKNIDHINNQKQLTIFYRTLNAAQVSKEIAKKRLKQKNIQKNTKQVKTIYRDLVTSDGNSKNVFQQNYMANPSCRGDIILNEVNKAKRKFKFRKVNHDPGSKKSDNFFYKI